MGKIPQSTLRYIDIKPLKQFAFDKLSDSPLKEILLLEDDRIGIHSFLLKLPIWLQLIRWMNNGGKTS